MIENNKIFVLFFASGFLLSSNSFIKPLAKTQYTEQELSGLHYLLQSIYYSIKSNMMAEIDRVAASDYLNAANQSNNRANLAWPVTLTVMQKIVEPLNLSGILEGAAQKAASINISSQADVSKVTKVVEDSIKAGVSKLKITPLKLFKDAYLQIYNLLKNYPNQLIISLGVDKGKLFPDPNFFETQSVDL